VTPAEILYDARDPYSQRIVIDRAARRACAPAIR
jgi:cell shape-determining protein MreC